MEKLEKKAKPEELAEVGGDVVQVVLRRIDSVPAAKREWRKLKDAAGLDQQDLEEIAEHLFQFCGGTKEQQHAGLKSARRFRKQFPSVVTQMRAAADTVDRMLRELRDIAGITSHPPRYDKLAANIRDFADELEDWGSAFRKSVAVDTRIEQDGKISGGRSASLSVVVSLVQEVITRDPYALIARLVAAVQENPEPNYFDLADSVRNAVNRYRRDAWGPARKKSRLIEGCII
jgi:hypothetical protein